MPEKTCTELQAINIGCHPCERTFGYKPQRPEAIKKVDDYTWKSTRLIKGGGIAPEGFINVEIKFKLPNTDKSILRGAQVPLSATEAQRAYVASVLRSQLKEKYGV